MKLVRNCGGHNYPFFETQKKQLQAVLDFDMPGYRYKGVVARDKEQAREKSLKYFVEQVYQEIVQCVQKIQATTDCIETYVALLQECQQLAIDIGTLIENCKGEGHPTVGILETFCEEIFGLSKEIVKRIDKNYNFNLSEDQDLLLALSLHLKPVINRYKYQILYLSILR